MLATTFLVASCADTLFFEKIEGLMEFCNSFDGIDFITFALSQLNLEGL